MGGAFRRNMQVSFWEHEFKVLVAEVVTQVLEITSVEIYRPPPSFLKIRRGNYAKLRSEKYPNVGSEKVPMTSPRSRNRLYSSQLVSGNSAQPWQAARLHESGP